MGNIRNIWSLIKAEFNIELRQKHTFASIILYVISTVFIISKVMQTVSPMLWNAIFWILFLFTAVNASIRIFSRELFKRELYYYYLINPGDLIVSKILYNFFSLFLSACLLGLSLILFVGNPIEQIGLFILAVSLGALGMSSIFTLVSSISAKGGNNAVLMSILSIPLVLPILLLNLKLTGISLKIIQDTTMNNDLIMVAAIIAIIFGIAVVLFPQIWKT